MCVYAIMNKYLKGMFWDSTGVDPHWLRFVGYDYVKTLQLNITANNKNSYALAA